MARNDYLDVYAENYTCIHDYIRRCVRDEATAEDMTQEVFLLVYRKWDELADHPNIVGYMMNAAKFNICKWYARQRRVMPEDGETLEIVSRDSLKGNDSDVFRMSEFYSDAESVLRKEDLSILKYYYVYGYTSAEMAQRLGISVSCFKARVARMKKELIAALRSVVLFILALRW